MSKRLLDIETANQLIIELIRENWRKSMNQYPVKTDTKAPYFQTINIDKTAGKIFDKDYFRRVDLYPQGEALDHQIGITALIDSEGKLKRWEIFRHYLGCYPVTIELTNVELNAASINNYLKEWQKTKENK